MAGYLSADERYPSLSPEADPRRGEADQDCGPDRATRSKDQDKRHEAVDDNEPHVPDAGPGGLTAVVLRTHEPKNTSGEGADRQSEERRLADRLGVHGEVLHLVWSSTHTQAIASRHRGEVRHRSASGSSPGPGFLESVDEELLAARNSRLPPFGR